MAFQNLFKKLGPAEEAVRNPGQTGPHAGSEPASTTSTCSSTRPRFNGFGCTLPVLSRTGAEDGLGAHRGQEEPGPPKKRRRQQETRAADGGGPESRIRPPDQPTSISTRSPAGRHRGNRGQNRHTCHERQTAGHSNNNRRKKTPDEQGDRRERGGQGPRGGGHVSRLIRRGGRVQRDPTQLQRSRSMTQEFQEQNVLLADGRLLCRHFLWGRCIKGDACQLEHVQGYNDLIKELCKFYVQGFCTKGRQCPYMHQSFPCKYFHRWGRCSQGPGCRFSHQPLTDVTGRLFEETLKRDELQQLAKQAREEPAAQAEGPPSSGTQRSSGVLLQPLRPGFYQSADADVESGAAFCGREEQPGEEAAAGEAPQPVSPSSPRQPVCYSVEAVLGPQWSRPFSRSLPAPGQKEFHPLHSAGSAPASRSRVPHDGDAPPSAQKAAEGPFQEEGALPEPVPGTVSCGNRPQQKRLRSGLHAGLEPPLSSVKLWTPGEKTQDPTQDPGGLGLGNPTEPSAGPADPRRPFRCLFAAPPSESLTRSRRPLTPGPASPSADVVHSAPRSFLSLFAAPLGVAPCPPHPSLRSGRKPRGQEAVVPSPEPSEEQPSEEQPAEEQPAEEQPSEEQPSEEQPAEEQPSEEQPSEEQPSEEQPSEEQPAEEQPAEEQPAEEQPAEEQPSEEQPAEEQPSEEQPAAHNLPPHPSSSPGEESGGAEEVQPDAASQTGTARLRLEEPDRLKGQQGRQGQQGQQGRQGRQGQQDQQGRQGQQDRGQRDAS